MGAVYSIDRIVVYNRADCCRGRINGATVSIDGVQCGSALQISSPDTCFNARTGADIACSGNSYPEKFIRSCSNAVGREIMVSLYTDQYLQVTEVFAYGRRST